MLSRKREHSRKPDELYDIIEQCSPVPYLELFARHLRPGWSQWGNEVDHNSQVDSLLRNEAARYEKQEQQLVLLDRVG